MARTLRDAKLDTRSARLRLAARREPYFRSLSDGLAIGYRRGAKGGTWIARHYTPEAGRRFNALGTADDVTDADGVHVLTFRQAQEAARDPLLRIADLFANYDIAHDKLKELDALVTKEVRKASEQAVSEPKLDPATITHPVAKAFRECDRASRHRERLAKCSFRLR